MYIPAAPSHAGWPTIIHFNDDSDTVQLPNLNGATVAGIACAIAGNVLISLALNCQKLAHLRLEGEREARNAFRKDGFKDGPSAPAGNMLGRVTEDDGELTPTQLRVTTGEMFVGNEMEPGETRDTVLSVFEAEPLLSNGNGVPSPHYGARTASQDDAVNRDRRKRSFLARLYPWGSRARNVDRVHVTAAHALMSVDVVPALTASTVDIHAADHGGNESDYLKSKLWWSGFLLMNVGEIGNFISYAFAPASVVAPLGTFALIANCLFAPLMLGERFLKRDFFGIIIAILGAVTVVLSANPSDVRLDPRGLINAITQHAFILYTSVYIIGIVILSSLSERPSGKRWVYVDVGLCALFGGFTVLSTKAVSTLLTMEWFEIFTEWITYPVIAVLIGTGVGQIKHLNRALMRFDSKVVVPTQFVLFNLSAIIGSAILYGDFRKATFHQIVTFLYGCTATFSGVFLITWAPRSGSLETLDEEGAQLDGSEASASVEDVAASSPRRVRMESLGTRGRPALLIPDGPASGAGSPILRHKQSVVSLMGFSPAQRLLLLNTPPRDDFRPLPPDIDHENMNTARSLDRRRTQSFLGDEVPRRGAIPWRFRPASGAGSRDTSRSTERDETRARSRSPF